MLTKQDNKMAQGLAIIAMVMLHLFCRTDNLPYSVHMFVGGAPLIYYLGLFGDMCVPIYCFCSGYAQYLLSDKEKGTYTAASFKRIGKFLFHFWIIVALFSCVGILAGKGDIIPISLSTFLGNIFLYKLSYNGAWWFVITYIILLLITPPMYRAVRKINSGLVVLISGIIYFIAYVFRFAYVLDFQNTVFNWIWNQAILLGTSQFSFVVGMIFYKNNIIGWLRGRLTNQLLRKILIVALPLLMFAIHCIERSLIIAPITGLITLICFYLWNKPKWAQKFFGFMGRHSMNIWLTHMFFYLTLFSGLVFKAKYPIVIFVYMMAICIAVSYIVDLIEKVLYRIFARTGNEARLI